MLILNIIQCYYESLDKFSLHYIFNYLYLMVYRNIFYINLVYYNTLISSNNLS